MKSFSDLNKLSQEAFTFDDKINADIYARFSLKDKYVLSLHDVYKIASMKLKLSLYDNDIDDVQKGIDFEWDQLILLHRYMINDDRFDDTYGSLSIIIDDLSNKGDTLLDLLTEMIKNEYLIADDSNNMIPSELNINKKI